MSAKAEGVAKERSMIWLLFTRKEFKALAVNWHDFVRGFLAMFRSYYGQFVGGDWYSEFVHKMSEQNEEFRAFWLHNDVNSAPEVLIEFRHAKVGNMLFDLTTLRVQGQTDLRCSVYTPSAGSDTERKVKHLMRRLGGTGIKFAGESRVTLVIVKSCWDADSLQIDVPWSSRLPGTKTSFLCRWK